MQPIVLTNAFLRPRATRLSSRIALSEATNVYANVEEMIDVIRQKIGASPLMLPTNFDPESVTELLGHIDGILLPGAASNIHPSRYGHTPGNHPQIFDNGHDETDMFLVRQARAQGIPFFGICRSMQAMNVAFGGTLHQKIDSRGGLDHLCSDPCDGHDDTPAFMHDIILEAGGLMALNFKSDRLAVNSIHEQAIDILGEGLRIEAVAPDGVIEAISWPEAKGFFAGVQWHPEALPNHPVSQKLFGLFRDAVEKRFAERHGAVA